MRQKELTMVYAKEILSKL